MGRRFESCRAHHTSLISLFQLWVRAGNIWHPQVPTQLSAGNSYRGAAFGREEAVSVYNRSQVVALKTTLFDTPVTIGKRQSLSILLLICRNQNRGWCCSSFSSLALLLQIPTGGFGRC